MLPLRHQADLSDKGKVSTFFQIERCDSFLPQRPKRYVYGDMFNELRVLHTLQIEVLNHNDLNIFYGYSLTQSRHSECKANIASSKQVFREEATTERTKNRMEDLATAIKAWSYTGVVWVRREINFAIRYEVLAENSAAFGGGL